MTAKAAGELRFAFYGRVSTEDNQDPESSMQWQLSIAESLIRPHGGQIVETFFDIGQSRALPWRRRDKASQLLASLKDPERGFQHIVIGEPHRAFYGNQFGLTLPLLTHHGLRLWVPEIGGPVDPDNEAHDLVMSVFGGLSKGERNRVKARVRKAMETQTIVEGRFLGGRPPYGYTFQELGPHPNPRKAADGRQLRGLTPDPVTAPVVARIFRDFLNGNGIRAIAESLTRDGYPCPSACDRARNPHRLGLAWAKGAVRVVLGNPRYTGRQVWNKQRSDEVLLDVEDVSLGHTSVRRWNPRDKWITSTDLAHEPIISEEAFEKVQRMLQSKARRSDPIHQHPSRHPYVFKGLIFCAACRRRMTGMYVHGATYYRCHYAAQYAEVNRIAHPRNILVREAAVVAAVDQWLAKAFAPAACDNTIAAVTSLLGAVAQAQPSGDLAADSYEFKLARYRAVIDAGGDPLIVARWINDLQQPVPEAGALVAETEVTSDGDIAAILKELGDPVRAIAEASPLDKFYLYRSLQLQLTYDAKALEMRAEIKQADGDWSPESVRAHDIAKHHI